MRPSWKIAVGILITVTAGSAPVASADAASEMTAPPLSLALAQEEEEEAQPPGPAKAEAEAMTGEKEPGEAPATQPAAATQPAPPVDPLQAAIAKVKNPFPWFNWGTDYRLRNEYLNNVFLLDNNAAIRDYNWLRHRLRWWSTVSLEDFLDFNTRIVWEGRNNCEPTEAQNWDDGEVLFDLLNFTLKKPAGLPFTVVGGRQEISLGDRWLVFEGTPGDGSRTIYFDAIRVTTSLDDIQTKIDTIYIEQDAEGENWVPMIKTRDENFLTGAPGQRYITEQDERGAIVWVENKSIEATEIDGYFIYKNDKRAAPTGFNSDLYTFGTRALHDLDEHWKVKGEIAGQFGHKNDSNVCALGSLNRLAYYFNDPHKNWLRLDYEYMSGDRPGTGTYEGFDPLWGRWPRFSELYIYTNAAETRMSDPSNMHRVALGHSVAITPKIEMLTDYHLLFADQNTFRDRAMFSDSGRFRGQLITWWLKYVITPQLSGHLVAEFFFPGDYYANTNNDPATFLRAEFVFAF
jgi:hypothetical protein